jgi:16S rRNA (cytosine967-C5)-methyltransferase
MLKTRHRIASSEHFDRGGSGLGLGSASPLNGAQVRGFVGRHPGFTVQPPANVVSTLGERAYLFRRAVLSSDEGLLMTPRRTDTDGFFVSILRRAA